ncbi:hypothetical protein KIN20_006174 [Parelaphostrongylus tenuis]|uniref:Uncharacterized protein n=1 Tax=Parelaphostrongylus tenuis TaxID=148309 RepID=A0AAD5MJS4_PARTN|nr:hypothetical protein KIN20_006174 [Parelaphostrongylus tenuis]
MDVKHGFSSGVACTRGNRIALYATGLYRNGTVTAKESLRDAAHSVMDEFSQANSTELIREEDCGQSTRIVDFEEFAGIEAMSGIISSLILNRKTKLALLCSVGEIRKDTMKPFSPLPSGTPRKLTAKALVLYRRIERSAESINKSLVIRL